MRLRRLLFACVAVLGLTVLAADEWEAERTVVKDFTVKDLDGGVLRSADLKGKIAVVDFWATWCAPCLKELPELSEYYQKIQGRSDVVFLSFDVQEEPADVRAFAKKKKLPYPIYLADSLADRYGIVVFPTKLIIDARGRQPLLRFRREGYTPVAEIEAKVQKLLGEPAS